MRIKSGYEIEKDSGKYNVVYNGIPTGAQLDSIVSSEIIVFLWDKLKEKDMTKTEMLDAVITKFDVSTVLALGNIDVFVRTLKKNGIIEE